jgi:hypothetical protein
LAFSMVIMTRVPSIQGAKILFVACVSAKKT